MDQSLTYIVGYGDVELVNVPTEPQREDWSMPTNLRYVGLDVHKDSILVAVGCNRRSAGLKRRTAKSG